MSSFQKHRQVTLPSKGEAAYAPLPTSELLDGQETAAKLPPETVAWRAVLMRTVDSTVLQVCIALLIMVNAVVIGLETDLPTVAAWDAFENVLLAVFFGELLLKMIHVGIVSYFDCQSPDIMWNMFDFLIVSLGICDFLLEAIAGKSTGGTATLFRVIRLLRILRIFRIVRYFKQLYMLAYGFSEAAQAIAWVTFFAVFILYVCSVVIARTVGAPEEDDQNYVFLRQHFGGILPSMLTLFMVMAQPDLEKFKSQKDLFPDHPGLCGFLIVFIIFGSFGMIALLTGVISESMFEKNELRNEENRIERDQKREKLKRECDAIYSTLELNLDGEATRADVEAILPRLEEILREACVDFSPPDLGDMVRVMDINHDGTISKAEFTHAVLFQAEGVRPMSLQEMHYDVSWVKNKVDKMSHLIEQIAEVHFDLGEHKPSSNLAYPLEDGDASAGSFKLNLETTSRAGQSALQPGLLDMAAAMAAGAGPQHKSAGVQLEVLDQRLADVLSKQKELAEILQTNIMAALKQQQAEDWATARMLLQEDFSALRACLSAARDCPCGGRSKSMQQDALSNVPPPRDASLHVKSSSLDKPRAHIETAKEALELTRVEHSSINAESRLAGCFTKSPSGSSSSNVHYLVNAVRDITSTVKSLNAVDEGTGFVSEPRRSSSTGGILA